jgi:hypothetical protein
MSGDADAKEGADTAVPEVAPISPVSPSPRGVSSPRNHGIPVLQHSPCGIGAGRKDRSASFQGIVASNAAETPIVYRLALRWDTHLQVMSWGAAADIAVGPLEGRPLQVLGDRF